MDLMNLSSTLQIAYPMGILPNINSVPFLYLGYMWSCVNVPATVCVCVCVCVCGCLLCL